MSLTSHVAVERGVSEMSDSHEGGDAIVKGVAGAAVVVDGDEQPIVVDNNVMDVISHLKNDEEVEEMNDIIKELFGAQQMELFAEIESAALESSTSVLRIVRPQPNPLLLLEHGQSSEQVLNFAVEDVKSDLLRSSNYSFLKPFGNGVFHGVSKKSVVGNLDFDNDAFMRKVAERSEDSVSSTLKLVRSEIFIPQKEEFDAVELINDIEGSRLHQLFEDAGSVRIYPKIKPIRESFLVELVFHGILASKGGNMKACEDELNLLRNSFDVNSERWNEILKKCVDPIVFFMFVKNDLASRMQCFDFIPYVVVPPDNTAPNQKEFEKWKTAEKSLLKDQLHRVQQQIDELVEDVARKTIKESSFTTKLRYSCCSRESVQSEVILNRQRQVRDVEEKDSSLTTFDQHAGLYCLIRRLIHYFNPSIQSLGTSHLKFHSKSLAPISDVGLSLISLYCAHTGIPEYFQDLVYLELLSKNLSNSVEYFVAVETTVRSLRKTIENSWFLREKKLFAVYVRVIFEWCKLLLSSYHDCFPVLSNADQVFRQCMKCQLSCFKALSKYHHLLDERFELEEDKWAKEEYSNIVGLLISESVQRHYEKLSIGAELKSDDGDGSVKSVAHMKRLLDLVALELDSASKGFCAIIASEIPGMICEKYLSDGFFPLVVEDLKRTLEVALSMCSKSESSFNKHVFALYSSFKSFFEIVEQFVSVALPEFEILFHGFVDIWLDIQTKEYPARVNRCLAMDREVDDSHRSSCVFDIFRLLYPMNEVFVASPYTSAQAVRFAQLISTMVTEFVDKIKDQIISYLSDEIRKRSRTGFFGSKENEGFKLEIDPKILTSFNNILTARIKLRDLLVDLKLERAYGAAAARSTISVGLSSILVSSTLSGTSSSTTEMPELEEKKQLQELNCFETFKYITDVLTQISKMISFGVSVSFGGCLSHGLSDESFLGNFSVQVCLALSC
eukprot:TRINITY_DN3013_c0_g1_i1.p1 TRINITY_DN3013_c0_g1~~TRINITY_DN3013_c0_g1_i1.p1  ORF type:complete len:956 (-),score=272.07 TRINITY_DN3013_c0_g1_i1:611-3478(-)